MNTSSSANPGAPLDQVLPLTADLDDKASEFRIATDHEENNAELHKLFYNYSRMSHYVLERMKALGHP